MTTYLTVITTVLVLTQIIRLIQNAIQLKRMKDNVDSTDKLIKRVYAKLEKALDRMEVEE